jgi:type III restriction enzyme
VGLRAVYDLSATPFFLRGSGYHEGTLFPWTVSDFSLMDAIECGIVKLPRVPVADNIPGGDMPKFRNLWEHIRRDMPKKGRGKSGTLDPLALPVPLFTALDALYGHYEKTFNLWAEKGISVPPVFIVVCNNTATSKAVYDYISGFHRASDDGKPRLLSRIAELAIEQVMPGVNNLGRFGRWEFTEFTAVYEIEARFNELIDKLCASAAVPTAA